MPGVSSNAIDDGGETNQLKIIQMQFYWRRFYSRAERVFALSVRHSLQFLHKPSCTFQFDTTPCQTRTWRLFNFFIMPVFLRPPAVLSAAGVFYRKGRHYIRCFLQSSWASQFDAFSTVFSSLMTSNHFFLRALRPIDKQV